MNNMNVVIDINSIKETKELMESECNQLIEMINKYKEMFSDTKKIFDTESAFIYRELANLYLDYVLNYIKNDFKVYLDSLDDIKKQYLDEISEVTKEIEGDE